MIRITEDRLEQKSERRGAIWVGDSTDEMDGYLVESGIGAVLCVAQDMTQVRCWDDGVEAMKVGLIDGPGNDVSAYCAAVLALHTLLARHSVLICCHTGSRSVVVAAMYLHLIGWFGLDAKTPTLMFDRFTVPSTLGKRLATIEKDVIYSVEKWMPTVHKAHSEAFDKMPWRAIIKVIDPR